MKLLILVCVSFVGGTPVLQKRSMPATVYDYYDFVEIPRSQTEASERSDGPVMGPVARSSGSFPRRIAMPLPPRHPPPPPPRSRTPPPGTRSQKFRPGREPDYKLSEPDVLAPQYRQRPLPQQPQKRPQYPPRPPKQAVRQPQPQYSDYDEFPTVLEDDSFYPQDASVFVEQPQYPRKTPVYEEVQPAIRDREPQLYVDEVSSHHQEQRQPSHKEERRPQYQEERRPEYQEEKRPQYQEERPHQEKRPQLPKENNPHYQEEFLPEYQDTLSHYEEDLPTYYEEELAGQYEQPSEKDLKRPPLNNYATTQDKAAEPVKEKRDVPHGGGHLDENGIKFAADAAAVENAKGAGRLAFQIHGQQGPHSYRFGYDTGKGYNRQFRYEERDGNGLVHGRYGFYDKDGKLQVVNYSAHPKHGFSADVPHP
ncbi:uncharacterized protein [Macrobrachium rosenbergii]|uniref:uncharacterized protein n=1 Tax=Macrobrachium rosenbergii TaxID=79674 RepID=UPI0034D4F7D9